MRFRFDPLSRAFLDRCVFGETAQRISVDGRPERFVRWCGRGLVSVMIYYHNHSCKSGHEPSFTAKLKMITTILRKFQPRSQSSSAISDVTSPVKLVGKIRPGLSRSVPSLLWPLG